MVLFTPFQRAARFPEISLAAVGILISILYFVNLGGGSFIKWQYDCSASNVLNDSVVASIALSSLVLLDIVIDIFEQVHNFSLVPFRSRMLRSIGIFPRMAVIVCVFVSNLVIRMELRRPLSSQLCWCVINFQAFHLLLASFLYLKTYFRDLKSIVSACTVLLGFLISDVISLDSNSLFSWRSFSGIFCATFYFLSVTAFLVWLYTIRSLRLFSNNWRMFYFNGSMMDASCFVMIIAVVLGKLLVLSSYFERTIDSLPLGLFAGSIYTLTTLSVLLSLIHSRLCLRPSKQILEENIGDARCSFIRYISHELRSPLNTISLGISLFKKSVDANSPMVNYGQVLSEMSVARDQNIGVLNDLATYEQCEREHLHIFLSDVMIHDFIKDVVNYYQENASQHEISLEYKGIGAESDQHLCRDICVKGDLNRLDQVSRSILMYLFKIAPKRSVLEVSEELVSADQRLSPHTRRKRRSSASLRLTGARSTHVAPIAFDVALQPRQFIRVMFSVSNFVLPENLIDTIESAFHRVDFEVLQTGSVQGSGLALWLAQRIVLEHRGRIEVFPQVGDHLGLTFAVEIPVHLIRPSTTIYETIAPLPRRVASTIRRGISCSSTGSSKYAINVLRQPSSGKPPSIAEGGEDEIKLNDGIDSHISVDSSSGVVISGLLNPALGHSRNRSRSNSNSTRVPLASQAKLRFGADRDRDQGEVKRSEEMSDEAAVGKDDEDEEEFTHRCYSNNDNRPVCRLLSYDSQPTRREYVENGVRSYSSCSVGRNGRVLIVDDVKSNRKLLLYHVKSLFKEFDEAVDGAVAVDKVHQAMEEGRPFDVILMDFIMPNMDGPTAAAEIRRLGYRGAIFGVTGNALQRDIDLFLESGANRVYLKPLDVADLEETLSE